MKLQRKGWEFEDGGQVALYKWKGGFSPAAYIDFKLNKVVVCLDTGDRLHRFRYDDYRMDGWPPQYDFSPLFEEIEGKVDAAEKAEGQFFRSDPERGENIAVVHVGAMLDGYPHRTAKIEPSELREDRTFVRAPYVGRVKSIFNPTPAMRERIAELGIK